MEVVISLANRSKLQMSWLHWRTSLTGIRDRKQIFPTGISAHLEDMAHLVRPELRFDLGASWSHQYNVLLCDAQLLCDPSFKFGKTMVRYAAKEHTS